MLLDRKLTDQYLTNNDDSLESLDTVKVSQHEL